MAEIPIAAGVPMLDSGRRGLTSLWRDLTLIQQFALIGLVVIGSGTLAVGAWVSHRIEAAVVQNSASSAAFYMSSLVEPVIRNIGPDGHLTSEQTRQLDELFASPVFAKSVVTIKIWTPGSKIAYSNHPEQVGRAFPMTDSLHQALSGIVAGEFNQLADAESEVERGMNLPLLEVYSPLRSQDGKTVVAVGEFYAKAEQLSQDLAEAKMASWLMVGLSGLTMFGALYTLVQRAGRTIATQQSSLRDRVVQLSQALARNEVLTARVDAANRRSVELNDHFLRRIGNELHDGPAQLLALALLRLDSLSQTEVPASPGTSVRTEKAAEAGALRKVIGDALKDIRDISGGLSLPEVQSMSMSSALLACAGAHERRTGVRVTCDLDSTAVAVPTAIKICLYRFAQEGLNNGFKHAGGVGQRLSLSYAGGGIEVAVADSGPGFDPNSGVVTSRLGLAGLRDRIVSLGGTLDIESQPGNGSMLIARFPALARG
jgi:signal transduction histidine kinase